MSNARLLARRDIRGAPATLCDAVQLTTAAAVPGRRSRFSSRTVASRAPNKFSLASDLRDWLTVSPPLMH
jgi:hypothetical protein